MIIWKAISLALKAKGLQLINGKNYYWMLITQFTLSFVLQPTQHHMKCFYVFQQPSAYGEDISTCLFELWKIFVKTHGRNSKFEPLVEADLIKANPCYAHARFS